MESFKESLYLLEARSEIETIKRNAKTEIEAEKRRQLALIYAMQEMEKERVQMHSALYESNHCADCARFHDCKTKKKRQSHDFLTNAKTPESYCPMWEWIGAYTPVSDLIALAMNFGKDNNEEKEIVETCQTEPQEGTPKDSEADSCENR